MTLAVTTLRQSWKELVEDCENEVFLPKSERDVQCYLYHLCIKNGLNAKLIHADMRYSVRGEQRSYTDLVLGNRPHTRLYVELKWIRVTQDATVSDTRMRRIMSDIDKSKKKKSKRQRYLLVFFYEKKGRLPLRRADLTKNQRRRIDKLLSKLETKGVGVLFSV